MRGAVMKIGTGSVAVSALLLTAACGSGEAQQSANLRTEDVRIDDTAVFPENLTATADGTLYIGSIKGNVYRALPGENVATAWIRTSEDNGILTILGVLAHEDSDTLWLCSVPNFFGPERSQGVSSLMTFNLSSGEQEGVYPLPPPRSVCNDITIGGDGTAYATDTSNGRIFRLRAGEDTLELLGEDPGLVGIDGIAFSEDGTLYANNVQRNEMVRIDVDDDGNMTGYTVLELSDTLAGPDGMRLIEGNRFVQAEGQSGRVAIVTIEGDRAEIEVLSDEFESTPGVTPIGNTAYVLESNIAYLTNPQLQGEDPGPFIVHAVPMQ